MEDKVIKNSISLIEWTYKYSFQRGKYFAFILNLDIVKFFTFIFKRLDNLMDVVGNYYKIE